MQQPSIIKPILILASTAILVVVMHLAAGFLVPVLLAFFFAILLSPIFMGLKRRRVPGSLALLLSIGFLLLVGLALLALVGGSLAVLASHLESYTEQFSQRQAELASMVQNVSGTINLSQMASAVDPGNLTDLLKMFIDGIINLLTYSIVIVMVTIFALAEGPQFLKRMRAAFGEDHFFPQNASRIADNMISYFGLRVLVNLVTAVATGLMLWLFNIPHVGLWMVLIFFLSFVPYIGAVFAMIPPVLLAYAQGGLGLAILIIVLAVVINGVSENIVAPMVMGKGLSISPTVVFLSFIFWMFVLGGAGVFIAIPLTLSLILFMGSFEETRSLAALMVSTPTPVAKLNPIEKESAV
jgi:AI-2 transport protein TqsA